MPISSSEPEIFIREIDLILARPFHNHLQWSESNRARHDRREYPLESSAGWLK